MAFMENRTTWGLWHLEKSNWTLVHQEKNSNRKYEIDLEKVTTGDEILDWIFHVSDKAAQFTSHDVGDLIKALNDVLDPRSNFGGGKPVDVTALLKQKY